MSRLKSFLSTFAFFSLFFIPFLTLGQDSLNVTSENVFYYKWHEVTALDVKDNYAFILDASTGLYIYDISIPNQPVFVGHNGNTGSFMKIIDNYALIVSSHWLHVIDISNISSPTQVSRYDLTDAGHIFYSEPYLIASCSYSIKVVNLSSPENPCLAGEYEPEEGYITSGIAVHNNVLVYTKREEQNSGRLHICDFSNPGNITELTSLLINDVNNGFQLGDVFLEGSNVFLVSERSDIACVDITNPNNPVLLSHIDSGNESSLQSFEYSNNLLYYYSYGNLKIYNYTNPSQPFLAQEINTADSFGFSLMEMSIKDSYLYSSDHTSFFIINVSDIDDLTLEYTLENDGGYNDFKIVNGYAYIIENISNLSIYDVSDPHNCVEVYRFNGDFRPSFTISGDFLYILAHENIHIFNISNPASTFHAGSIALSDWSQKISSSDNYLFALFQTGAKVYDVSASPESPVYLFDLDEPHDPDQYSVTNDFTSQGNYIYTVGSVTEDETQFNFSIYEVVNNVPEVVSRSQIGYAPPYYLDDIYISENYAYLCSEDLYAIIDISNPISPVQIQAHDTESIGGYKLKAFMNGFIYLANYLDFKIIDVSDPYQTWLSGYYDINDYGDPFVPYYSTLRVDNSYIYVANSGHTRIKIFSCENALSTNNNQLSELPDQYQLVKAYPNPFNPTLNIRVSLPETGVLKLTVHNVLGQEVAKLADRTLERGYHNFTFDGSDLSSGVYFVKAVVEGKMNDVQKVMLMK